MSTDDDNALKDLDLSAWDAPEAPGGLADAVIARLATEATTEAAPEMATATEIDRRGSRRTWVFAGVATAVAAAAGVWLVVHLQREPHDDSPTSGTVLADRARHVDLDGVSAELDLGADVRWRKTPAGLRIEQHAGAATWRVASGDHVVIDAGAGSGAAASIDATGASLRVEIQPMNMSDARVIGASALTSAAVAMITVVVYEGHVKATSAGQTVVVQPGSTVEIRPDQAPKDPLHVGLAPPDPAQPTTADLAIEAGQSVTIHDPDGNATVQIRGSCTTSTSISLGAIATVGVQPNGVIAVPEGHHAYAVRCDGSPTLVAAGTIDVVRDAADGHTTTTTAPIAVIDEPVQGATWSSPVHLAGQTIDGAVVTASGRGIIVDDHHRFAGDLTLDSTVLAIRVVHPQHGVHYYLRRAGSHDVTVGKTCDAEALRQKGSELASQGKREAALASFEAAYKCTADVHTVELAFMSACNVPDLTAAREYYALMSAEFRDKVIVMCIRNGITKAQLEAPCDADQLSDQAREDLAQGHDAHALQILEEAYRCKAEPSVVRLAFLAACNGKNLSKAQHYYSLLSSTDRPKVVAMCIRNGIMPAQLDAVVQAPVGTQADFGILRIESTPAAHIYIDGTDTKLSTPITGDRLKLAPGRHKVTFAIDGNRYTYPVTIEAKKTVTLSKDLR